MSILAALSDSGERKYSMLNSIPKQRTNKLSFILGHFIKKGLLHRPFSADTKRFQLEAALERHCLVNTLTLSLVPDLYFSSRSCLSCLLVASCCCHVVHLENLRLEPSHKHAGICYDTQSAVSCKLRTNRLGSNSLYFNIQHHKLTN